MPDISQRLQRAWYRRSAPWALRPLSGLYRLIIATRRALYRLRVLSSDHPGVPVVVVGNISVGGTGKTPVVQWLASQLRARGVAVGIATRGYGGSDAGPRIVDSAASADQVGDEALLLARTTDAPVCVARRRALAARTLARHGCTLILCDDGLQHLALRRDLEIAVIDARRGLGNGAMLPAGPLREPVKRLRSVDLLLINGGSTAPGLPAALSAQAIGFDLALHPAQSLTDGQPRPLSDFAAGTVHAVAGIGDPGRFFTALRAAGLALIEHAFADHHAYRPGDLAFNDDRPVLMTQKDAVKCTAFADGRMWCVPVGARFAQHDAARIVEKILHLLPGGGPWK
ncbi:MAG: tetraacyldisaccharide 4'-kinase [Nevskiaceae bacterium]|jgi:tetraacyldisaccharide 4'-kinase|nr:tetraacyldisaccharide 4'-kinase [Nevskiaceae bacterium]